MRPWERNFNYVGVRVKKLQKTMLLEVEDLVVEDSAIDIKNAFGC